MTKTKADNLRLHGAVGMISRRSFAKGALLSGLFVSTLTADALALTLVQERQKGAAFSLTGLPEKTLLEIRTLTRSWFAKALNDNFVTTYGAGDTVVLQLVEIYDLPSAQATPEAGKSQSLDDEERRENSFALLFRGAFNQPLPQKIFKLRHPQLGELEIFIVPVGRVSARQGARFYEAVFNRVVE